MRFPSRLGRLCFFDGKVYSAGGWLARELGLDVDVDTYYYLNDSLDDAGTQIGRALGISRKEAWSYIDKWDRIENQLERGITFMIDARRLLG